MQSLPFSRNPSKSSKQIGSKPPPCSIGICIRRSSAMDGRPTCEEGRNILIKLHRSHQASLWIHHLYPTSLQTLKQHFQQISISQQVLQLFLKLSNCQIYSYGLRGSSDPTQNKTLMRFISVSLLINQKISNKSLAINEKRFRIISCTIGVIYSLSLQYLSFPKGWYLCNQVE